MTRRRATASSVTDAIREAWGIHDIVRAMRQNRFMCLSVAQDFDETFLQGPPEQIDCKGCGAPRPHDQPGKCEYCGRPT